MPHTAPLCSPRGLKSVLALNAPAEHSCWLGRIHALGVFCLFLLVTAGVCVDGNVWLEPWGRSKRKTHQIWPQADGSCVLLPTGGVRRLGLTGAVCLFLFLTLVKTEDGEQESLNDVRMSVASFLPSGPPSPPR